MVRRSGGGVSDSGFNVVWQAEPDSRPGFARWTAAILLFRDETKGLRFHLLIVFCYLLSMGGGPRLSMLDAVSSWPGDVADGGGRSGWHGGGLVFISLFQHIEHVLLIYLSLPYRSPLVSISTVKPCRRHSSEWSRSVRSGHFLLYFSGTACHETQHQAFTVRGSS